MPWKIVPSHYDPSDLTTLHDDEMIALDAALSESAGEPLNETNPRWRAWQKIRPLAAACTGQNDPIHLLPPEARTSPRWEDHARDGRAAAGPRG
jgi:hypothetical protein